MDTIRKHLPEIAESLAGINEKLGVIVEEIESLEWKSGEASSLSDILVKLEEYLDGKAG